MDMNVKKVLESFNRGGQLTQPIVKWLYHHGYIEVSRVTNFDSPEEELLPTFITEKGRRLLER